MRVYNYIIHKGTNCVNKDPQTSDLSVQNNSILTRIQVDKRILGPTSIKGAMTTFAGYHEEN